IGAIVKKKGKKAEVNLAEFGKAAGLGLVGFGASNLITQRVNSYMTEQGRSPLNGNLVGLLKIGLGLGTAYLGGKSKGMTTEIVSLAIGMGTSGVADLTRKNLPQVANTLGLDSGINAIPLPMTTRSYAPGTAVQRKAGSIMVG
ncbi:MAG: hypothetical protein AAFO94_06315, partial [Bacteroidota bacterium]